MASKGLSVSWATCAPLTRNSTLAIVPSGSLALAREGDWERTGAGSNAWRHAMQNRVVIALLH
jgi:hypothetical protein